MAEHNILGAAGEEQAALFLSEQGYRILHRNWKAPKTRHELDIVAIGENRLVIVEVKTRSGEEHGQPFDAVDWRKQRSLASAANSYVRLYHIDLPLRFDVIGIVDGKIEHIKAAFLPSQRWR